MATFDLGRVTPLYKGDYDAATSYELNDVVLYDGNLYWHVQATPTVGILPTDTTVWKLAFADEGVRAEICEYAENAHDSADSASASKSAAAQSASQASASASQAALSAQTAQTAETGATASAQTASTKASESSASAQSAASSAQTATDKATLASQKAAAASESASLATAKASAAATSETNATRAANTATTKASEAAASATNAQGYNDSAQQSAVNAQTSATNAAASATSAQGYSEVAAQSAEDAAESASRAEAFYYLPTDTAEGPIASFSDGANTPVKSLVVDIDPVQDLHGYDAPWPGGGGKNLFGLSDFTNTYSGVTYAYESLSGKLSTNGTSTAGAGTNVGEITVPEGTYTFSADFTNASGFAQIFLRDKATSANVEEIRSDRPQRTVALNGTYYIRIAAQNGSVNSGYINHIQLELGESKTNFAPYSNICPISGWTGVNINKSGINIWDEETELGNVSSTTGAKFNANNRIRTKNYISVVPGTQYKIVYQMTGTIGTVAYYDSGKNFISALFPSANAVITAPSNAYYMLIGFTTGYGVTYNNDISINYPSTDADYHPYSGETVNISFPTEAGTVYGGTLDVTNGVLTVTKGYIQSYNGETLPSTWISDRDVYAQGATPTTGAEVCYDLSTPVTYNLTPTEVRSLLGANNIWADTGDTAVEYRADIKGYIAKKIAEAISALS